jgi:predicted RNase H-like HicB family nuclease
VVFTKLQQFDTLAEAEAELKKAIERGERAYILSPRPPKP